MAAIPRRSFMKIGAIGSGALLTSTAAGCGANPGIVRFLEYLGEQVAQGFGITAGESIADGAEQLFSRAVDYLTASSGTSMTGDPLYGYASDWRKPSPMRALVAAAFQKQAGTAQSWQSHSVLVNGETNVWVPSVVALGSSMFAQEKLRDRLAAIPQNQRSKATSGLRDQLRKDYSIVVWEKIQGAGDAITDSAVFRAITSNNKNLEVSWDPTTSRTEQSRIVIREGVVLKGVDPTWDSTVVRGIPSYLLWDPEEKAVTA